MAGESNEGTITDTCMSTCEGSLFLRGHEEQRVVRLGDEALVPAVELRLTPGLLIKSTDSGQS